MPSNDLDAWNDNADEWASTVDAGVDPNHEAILEPTLGALLGDAAGLRALDLGCGEGRLSRFVAGLGAHVTAVDFAPRMIELATARSEGYGIDYRVGDAEQLDETLAGAAPYDVVLLDMALFCMERPGVVLEHVAKVIRPDGRLIVTLLHPCFPLRIYQEGTLVEADPGFNNPEAVEWPADSYFNRRTVSWRKGDNFPRETRARALMLEEYSELLRNAGFRIERLVEPRPPRAVLDDTTYKSHDLYPRFPFFLVIEARPVVPLEGEREALLQRLRSFRDVRDWKQYQTPKNNAISIILEAAELLNHFHWVDSPADTAQYLAANRAAVVDEMADVYMNLLLLAEDLHVSLDAAVAEKLTKLGMRYPAGSTFGRAVTPAERDRYPDDDT